MGRDIAFATQVVTAAVKRGKRARLVGTCCHQEADLLIGLVS